MRILFIGGYKSPGGPNEVNRNLLKHIADKVVALKSRYRKIQVLESILPIFRCDIVIFSGLMFTPVQLRLAKALKKKIIYIMHGCSKIENGHIDEREESILSDSDRILCVSKTYSELIQKLYPKFSNKVFVLFNGINWDEFDLIRNNLKTGREKNRIILFGGGRKIKNNLIVCQAVHELNQESDLNLHIDIYGYFNDNDDSKLISDIPCVTFHNIIPHDKVNEELYRSRLFIQNSEFESFSLALTDALGLGCDVLLSKHVGAGDIIPGKEAQDIIYNPNDIAEIKEKIVHVIKNPNNKRLLESIDRKSTSLVAAADNLIEYCRLLHNA